MVGLTAAGIHGLALQLVMGLSNARQGPPQAVAHSFVRDRRWLEARRPRDRVPLGRLDGRSRHFAGRAPPRRRGDKEKRAEVVVERVAAGQPF